MFPLRLLTIRSSLISKFCQHEILSPFYPHSRLHSLSSANSTLFKPFSRTFAMELRRGKRAAAVNLGILMVPQQEAWILERFGKFHKTLEPVSAISFLNL